MEPAGAAPEESRVAFALPPEAPLSARAPNALDASRQTGTAVEAADPGAVWIAAGALLSGLTGEFPCSQLTLVPGPDGAPSLRARVWPPADMAVVQARIAAAGVTSDVSAAPSCAAPATGAPPSADQEASAPPEPAPRLAPRAEPPVSPVNPARARAAPTPAARNAGAAEAREVDPVAGPPPALPEGLTAPPEGYAVEIGFKVDADGRASDLSLIAGGVSIPVAVSALEVVSASQFPPAEPGATYRARHTVRFPPAKASITPDAAAEVRPVWKRRPSDADIDRLYPVRALRRGVAGHVLLRCRIDAAGELACDVVEEKPGAWSFDEAALGLSALMRAAPEMTDGSPSVGRTVELTFEFDGSTPSRP